jgi:peptide/nickel transport system permease protein
MSNLDAGFFPADPAAMGSPPPAATPEPARSFTQLVLRDTFRRLSARLGAVWIAVILVIAVLSPVLCSSFPLLVKIDSKWSSPLLAHLHQIDVILLISGAAAVVLLLMRRTPIRARLANFFAIFCLSILFAGYAVHPRMTDPDWMYRQLAADGRLQVKIDTLVPFSITDRLRDQSDMDFHEPDRVHWMGTDDSGADVLAGMMHGCLLALSVGIVSTAIAVVIGCAVGSLMGYFSGIVDILGMRIIEIVSSIPTLFLLLMLSAVAGPRAHNLYLIMVIIGLTAWDGYARFVRAEFLKLRGQDFVQAAVASGLPLRSVLFRHMMPNALSPVLVGVSFGTASAILAESTLSFLGLGLIDEPSWGRLLSQALGSGGNFHWWLATYPGLAIFLTVFAYNLVGESLRDAIDPKLRR